MLLQQPYRRARYTPIDIECALHEDYSSDATKRDLQLEAKAHIEVQQLIDNGGLEGRSTTAEGILETHRRFCELLPEELLWVESPDGDKREKLLAGELRQRDVKVGQHIAVSPAALPRFMERFPAVYQK